MPSLSFRLTWEFLSDWHIGSGLERPGSYDQLVQRDPRGLPFLPAKTQTGIFRDTAEETIGSLGEHWNDWLRWLLGDESTQGKTPAGETPRPAALSIRAAHVPDALAARLGNGASFPGAAELADAFFFGKPGVKVDASGQAEENCLRIVEMCRGGVTLSGLATLDTTGLSGTQIDVARHLIALVAGCIERVGGKRRRGAGKVRLKLGPGDPAGTLPDSTALGKWLAGHEKPGVDPPAASKPAGMLAIANPLDDEWLVLPFRIELRGPVLVTERTVGNVVRTLDFIPGTLLVPLVARVLRSHQREGEIPAGNVRVSPATIEIDDQPSFPVPAALFHPKEGERWFDTQGTVHNPLVESESPNHNKDFRQGYVTTPEPGRLPRFQTVKKVIRPHNTVQDEKQRPTSDVGGVYTYQAIAAGQTFRGELRIRRSIHDNLPAGWWRELAGPVALGRSKKDDYGEASFTWKADEPVALEQRSGNAASGALTLWLTSDTLLLDDNQRPATTAKDLHQALQVLAGSHGVTLGDLTHAYIHHRRLETWQVGWGLPRPSLVAIKAGSCLKVQIDHPIDAKTLGRLEAEGLGLRRAEGFGQFRLDAPLLTASTSGKDPAERGNGSPSPAPPEHLPAGDPCSELARALERECWRRRIRARVVALAHSRHEREKALGFREKLPGASQVGTARSIVRLPADFARAAAEQLNEKLKRKGTADEGRWTTKLKDLVDQPNAVWDLLDSGTWPVLTEGGREALQRELQVEALRSLVDAVAKAHVRQLQAQ